MRARYTEITHCRICGNNNLVPVLNLGTMAMTGIFPRQGEVVPEGPLELVKCHPLYLDGDSVCHLVQLRQSYNPADMYGSNYGYRSGLNASMVKHLGEKVAHVRRFVDLGTQDTVVDIGSNDGTLLRAYGTGCRKIGVDPSGKKFAAYYPMDVVLIPEFFSANLFTRKAKAITSIAMFYDLEDPLDFMKQVRDTLTDDGIWVFEQSYLPRMLEQNAYDTVCHEHLSYYGLRQIALMTDRAGLKIIDVQFNDVNGGSFSVTAAKRISDYEEWHGLTDALNTEASMNTLEPFQRLVREMLAQREALVSSVRDINAFGGTVYGYGASTKGNVMLQLCGFTAKDIIAIADVNENKFGCFTPGSNILIVPEIIARAAKPDYFIVFPWHFRDGIVEREKEYLKNGGALVFPLPKMEVVHV